MSPIDLFFESQPAIDALARLLDMAREQEDYDALIHFSEGIQHCESVIDHLLCCYEQEDATPVA